MSVIGGFCATIVDVPVDPVLERRRRIARVVDTGQRVGYGLFGLATVGFVVGLVRGFGGAVTPFIVTAIVVGSIVLAPAIVFGYAVKAAEREDRAEGRRTLADEERAIRDGAAGDRSAGDGAAGG